MSNSALINVEAGQGTAVTKDQTQPRTDLKILCFNLEHLSPLTQFLFCCTGVFFFFLIYGYCQVSSAGG